MYNPELKQKFIDQEKPELRGNDRAFFRLSFDSEKKMCKDVSLFDRGEIIRMLNQSTFFIPKNIRNHLAVMNRYVAFAGGNEKIYKTITPKDLDFSQIIKTCLFRNVGEIIANITYKRLFESDVVCLMALIYLGLPMRDAISLNTERINVNDQSIDDYFGRKIISGGDDESWTIIQSYWNNNQRGPYFLPPTDSSANEHDPIHLQKKLKGYADKINAEKKSVAVKSSRVQTYGTAEQCLACIRLTLPDFYQILAFPKRRFKCASPGYK